MASLMKFAPHRLLVASALYASSSSFGVELEIKKSGSANSETTVVAEAFTVLTYNVENLFDVDGVALFNDYKQGPDGSSLGYTRAKFLTKLQNIAKVLGTINEGAGPEVVLFQELEADFTPESKVASLNGFLETHSSILIEDMLGAKWNDDYAGYSSSAWLLKAMADAGLRGYVVADTPARAMASGIAHTNAVFSKFPIKSVARHPLIGARDIIVAELDVDGHSLYVYVNHWKSGASNPNRERARIENAKVLRALLDAHLKKDPSADIIVAGDLNSHYNHDRLYPEAETGINDVLGSDGSESFDRSDLYNLWFELPPEERYSEVWRGRRGTLMHKMLTPGLYDGFGICYVDGSFDKCLVAGLNADSIGRPLKWKNLSLNGSGASDHFPILAQFRIGAFRPKGLLSKGNDALSLELRHDYDGFSSANQIADGTHLSNLDGEDLGLYFGHVFQVKAHIVSAKPLRLRMGGKEWHAYVPSPSLRAAVSKLPINEDLDLIVTLGVYRGQEQLEIEAIK